MMENTPNTGKSLEYLTDRAQRMALRTLHALAYCNIHGLWESKQEVSLA